MENGNTTEYFEHTTRPHRSHRRLLCTCLGHEPLCKKRRGAMVSHRKVYGDWEPVAYLIAWARKWHQYPRGHVPRCKPSNDEVQAVIKDLRAAGHF